MERLAHIIETQQFTVKWLEEDFFPLVDKMKKMLNSKGIIAYLRYFFARRALTGKNVVEFFFGASTRTMLTFQFAVAQLNGNNFATDNAGISSSAVKGESLRDTIKIISGYRTTDVIVLRTAIAQKEKGMNLKEAVPFSTKPIINAGDRNEQHPTQTLIDLYTIKKEKGRIAGLTIGLGGDIGGSRTVKSLIYVAAKYPGTSFIFISPQMARIPEEIKDHLRENRVEFREVYDIKEVAHLLDVYYVVRMQVDESNVVQDGGRNLTPNYGPPAYWKTSQIVRDRLSSDAIIMHPLPRTQNELPYNTDEDFRSRYFEQAINGEPVRMALLLTVIKNKHRKKFLKNTNPLSF